MRRTVRAAVAAAALAAMFTACTATPSAVPAVPNVTAAPASTGKFNSALAYQNAWHIEGGGKYAIGSVDTCDLNLPISIEDAAALANPDTTVPIFGMVFTNGEISYGTVWPTAAPGTGIVSGTGTYSISYDSSGLPTTLQGTAKLKWHDAKKSPAISTRADQLTLTFTKEPRADRCP